MNLFSKALALFLVPALSLLSHGQEAVPAFNGKDLTGWTDAKGKAVTEGWEVEEGGILHRKSKSSDLYTAMSYGDFELSWEWKVAEGGNSGVKYRLATYDGKTLGLEYQLLDDARHPDGKIGPHRQSGALYDIKAPDAAVKKLNAPGEWNTSKIVVKGNTIEHWLNGAKVVTIEVDSDEWKARIAKSKFKTVTGFGTNATGRIHLQDHGDEAWFRNITIKALTPPVPAAGK